MVRTGYLSLLVLVASSCVELRRVAQETSSQSKLGTNAVDLFLDQIRAETEFPEWAYSKLKTESDVIVVGKSISKSSFVPDDDPTTAFASDSARYISNRIRVLVSLRGQPSNQIEVVTLEWKSNVIVQRKHEFATLSPKLLLPNFTRTELDGEIIEYGLIESNAGDKLIVSRTIEPEYLLFLRLRTDGRFDPVTGQRYSGMSVKLLNN